MLYLYSIFIIIIFWILYQKSYYQMYEPQYQLIDISSKNKPNIITYNIQKFLWSCKTFNPIVSLLNNHSIILLQECYDESFSKLKTTSLIIIYVEKECNV